MRLLVLGLVVVGLALGQLNSQPNSQPNNQSNNQSNILSDLNEASLVDTLLVDEVWKPFYFRDLGVACHTRYEFSTKEFAYLEIADPHCKGDQFGIFDGDSLLGSTNDCGGRDEEKGVGWGIGKFFLPKGSHNITILTLKGPFGDGSAAIRLTSVIPSLQ